MKLLIKTYDPIGGFHYCEDENGNTRRVDLNVDASMIPPPPTEAQECLEYLISLAGKTVEVERFTPYIEIGYNVTVL